MRFKLTLQHEPALAEAKYSSFPIDYQFGLSSFIYKTLFAGDNLFATWLHNNGYDYDKHKYKLFTFSHLVTKKSSYQIEKDIMSLNGSTVTLFISFLAKEAIEPFIIGLFREQNFFLGHLPHKTIFKVVNIEKLPEPEFKTEMSFTTLSPVVVSNMKLREGKNPIANYINPQNDDFSRLFFKNLVRKHNAWCQHEGLPLLPEALDNLHMQITTPGKMKSLIFKKGSEQQTKVIGHEFGFRLNAPVELMKTGYYAGFGEKNSMGFGCVEVNRQLNNLSASGKTGTDSVEIK